MELECIAAYIEAPCTTAAKIHLNIAVERVQKI